MKSTKQPEQHSSLKTTTKSHDSVNPLQSCWINTFTDCLTIVLSIADVITNIIVLSSYYQNDDMTLFDASLTILLISQIVYCLLFCIIFDIPNFFVLILAVPFVFFVCIEWDEICAPCDSCSKKYCGNCNWWRRIGICCVGCIYGVVVLPCSIITLAIIFAFTRLAPMLIYFVDDDDSCCGISRRRSRNINIDTRSNIFAIFVTDSSYVGYVSEILMDVLPQSIVKIIAIRYYLPMENYDDNKNGDVYVVYFISLLISISSIMSKLFIIIRDNHGVEWKSVLFCWFCVITDLLSVYFIISWILLPNDKIKGDFFGYFGLIGQLWCYKVFICTGPLIGIIAVGYVLMIFWYILDDIWKNHNCDNYCCGVIMICLFIICGQPLIFIGYCIFIVVAEISCFSIVAGFIFIWLIKDRWDYDCHLKQKNEISSSIKRMLTFVSDNKIAQNSNKKYAILRILSLNYGYYHVHQEKQSHGSSQTSEYKLYTFIKQRKENYTIDAVTYKDIRDNCQDSEYADRLGRMCKDYLNSIQMSVASAKVIVTNKRNDTNYKVTMDDVIESIQGTIEVVFFCVTIPMYILGRIVGILYPYFVMLYISYYRLWIKLDLVELIFLCVYALLECLILSLAYFVFHTHWWLWHIIPGEKSNYRIQSYEHEYIKKQLGMTDECFIAAYKCYDEIQWLPRVTVIIIDKFGDDVASIIIEYIKCINAIDDESDEINKADEAVKKSNQVKTDSGKSKNVNIGDVVLQISQPAINMAMKKLQTDVKKTMNVKAKNSKLYIANVKSGHGMNQNKNNINGAKRLQIADSNVGKQQSGHGGQLQYQGQIQRSISAVNQIKTSSRSNVPRQIADTRIKQITSPAISSQTQLLRQMQNKPQFASAKRLFK